MIGCNACSVDELVGMIPEAAILALARAANGCSGGL